MALLVDVDSLDADLAALGVYPSALTAPLLAAWDFSAPMMVIQGPSTRLVSDATNWGIYARHLSIKTYTSPLFTDRQMRSVDPLGSGLNNDWVATGQFPNASRINGLTVWRQIAATPDYLYFQADGVRVLYPDIFSVFQLSAGFSSGQSIVSTPGSCDFSTVQIYDDVGTLKWGVYYAYDTPFIRPTNALVDTSAHVICFPSRGDKSLGLWMDGVFYPWTDSDPAGWIGHAYQLGNFDFSFAGASGLDPAAGPEGLYAEVRLYDPLTDAERASVTSQLMAKWGIG